MDRRIYLIALVALMVIAGGAVWLAVRTVPNQVVSAKPIHSAADLPVLADSVPSLDGNQGWLNSPALTPADLKGKVVLYDFWTYSCINCLRTIPHLQALYARYHAQGLEIVGIHSPEFDFEKDHGNVTQAVKDLGVTWPVAFDDNMAVWQAFGNQYWPAEYLADEDGKIRSVHFGEGDYSQKEDEVRALLGIDASASRAGATGTPDPTATALQTPEMHLGTSFDGPQWCSSPGDYATRADFTVPDSQPGNTFALSGSWAVGGQDATSASSDATLVLRYQATEVNGVLSSSVSSGPGSGALAPQVTTVIVELDGQEVPAAMRPPGMTEQDGHTVIAVGMSDLYHLIEGGPSGAHTLTLRPTGATSVFAFTYGTIS
ncbi:MAG: hypothetical protein QOE63_320 [Acidimicrobiaceae bacterium]